MLLKNVFNFLFAGLLLISFYSTAQNDWLFEVPPSLNFNSYSINNVVFDNHKIDPSTKDIYLIGDLQDSVNVDGISYVTSPYEKAILIVKLTPDGSVAWSKQIGGYSNTAIGDIAIANSFIVVGLSIEEQIEIDGNIFSPSNGRILLLKYDKDGNYLTASQKRTNGTISKMEADGDQSIIISGIYTFNSKIDNFILQPPSSPYPIANYKDIFFAKLNSNLNAIWAKNTRFTNDHFVRSSKPLINGLKIINSGQFILIGKSPGSIRIDGELIGNKNTTTAFASTFYPDGQKKDILHAQSTYVDNTIHFSDAYIDAQNSLYVTGWHDEGLRIQGHFYPTHNDSNRPTGFVIKSNADREFMWIKQLYGPHSNTSSITTIDDKLYISGTFRNYLDFDNRKFYDAGRNITLGFIAQILPDGYLHTFKIFDSQGYSSIRKLSDYGEGEIFLSGAYSTDIRINCNRFEANNGFSRDFFSKMHLNSSLGSVGIQGVKQGCEDDEFRFEVTNYNPAVSYEWLLPEGTFIKDSVVNNYQHEIILDISGYSENTLEISVVGSFDCTSYISSQPFVTTIDYNPKVSSKINSAAKLCRYDNAIISVDPMQLADSYQWTLPAGLKATHGSLTTIDNYILVDALQAFDAGKISVVGINSCGVTDPIEAYISVTSDLERPVLIGDTLLCKDGSLKEFKALTNDTDVTFLWEISDRLNFVQHDQRSWSTDRNEVSVEMSSDINSKNQYISLKTRDSCFESEEVKLRLQLSNLVNKPNITIGECDRFIQTDAQTDFTWFYEGEELTGINSPLIDNPVKGTYRVKAENYCNIEWSDEYVMQPVNNLDDVIIPNIITPNGDGLNDFLRLDEALGSSTITIYNRWGKEIFHSENYKNNWNANDNSGGVYFYTLRNDCITNEIRSSITVIK